MSKVFTFLFLFVSMAGFCNCQKETSNSICVGAERTEQYLPFIKDKSVAIVANHTSLVNGKHLVDTLLNRGVEVKRIFSPEHGFRGDKDAGEIVETYTDGKTGLPVVSLYGNQKKPREADLKDIDVVVFDIQDVGVRFYTYITTMHYVMEACAETRTKLLILDRPNPNGFYIDGPVLDTQYRSFVGIHPIPVVHGLTIAELARMINNEGWLDGSQKCDLRWVKCENYTHDSLYRLPVKPSPNLPNMRSVYLYPSLGLFEGTTINVGRGTDFPFQVFGHPEMSGEFFYTPRSINGASQNPKHKDKVCEGIDLRTYPLDSLFNNPGLRLKWLKYAYKNLGKPDDFFLTFFTNLSGNKLLKKQLVNDVSIERIKKSWEKELKIYREKRKKYLLYEDFSN